MELLCAYGFRSILYVHRIVPVKKMPNKLMHLIIYHRELKQHYTGKWSRIATAMMTTAAFLVFIDQIASYIQASMMPIV